MFSVLRIWAHALKRDVHAIYLAAHHPGVPWHAKLLAIAVAGYALSPIDLIPDFIPVLGYVDDLIIVPLGIWLVVWLVPKEIMAECRAIASEAEMRPHGKVVAIIIVAIWIVGAALLAWAVLAYWGRSHQALAIALSTQVLAWSPTTPHFDNVLASRVVFTHNRWTWSKREVALSTREISAAMRGPKVFDVRCSALARYRSWS